MAHICIYQWAPRVCVISIDVDHFYLSRYIFGSYLMTVDQPQGWVMNASLIEHKTRTIVFVCLYTNHSTNTIPHDIEMVQCRSAYVFSSLVNISPLIKVINLLTCKYKRTIFLCQLSCSVIYCVNSSYERPFGVNFSVSFRNTCSLFSWTFET